MVMFPSPESQKPHLRAIWACSEHGSLVSSLSKRVKASRRISPNMWVMSTICRELFVTSLWNPHENQDLKEGKKEKNIFKKKEKSGVEGHACSVGCNYFISRGTPRKPSYQGMVSSMRGTCGAPGAGGHSGDVPVITAGGVGACFSCRFSNFLKPATLISKYLAGSHQVATTPQAWQTVEHLQVKAGHLVATSWCNYFSIGRSSMQHHV